MKRFIFLVSLLFLTFEVKASDTKEKVFGHEELRETKREFYEVISHRKELSKAFPGFQTSTDSTLIIYTESGIKVILNSNETLDNLDFLKEGYVVNTECKEIELTGCSKRVSVKLQNSVGKICYELFNDDLKHIKNAILLDQCNNLQIMRDGFEIVDVELHHTYDKTALHYILLKNGFSENIVFRFLDPQEETDRYGIYIKKGVDYFDTDYVSETLLMSFTVQQRRMNFREMLEK